MTNERETENLVRDQLRSLDYYSDDNDVRVEEQKSEIVAIKRLLRSASKTGGGGRGSPEFIVSSAETGDFMLIVECKGDVKRHESPGRDSPAGFAVDGALHYALVLSREFNVIALAVSGQRASKLKISTFLQPRGVATARPLTNEHGAPIARILSWAEFIRHATFDPLVQQQRHDDLMAFSRDLHNFMRNHMKLTESEKPLMVSGTLIALRNKAFARTFGDYAPEELQSQWIRVIREEIDKAVLPNAKKLSMTQPYASIAVHPVLGKPTGKAAEKFPKGVLYELIRQLNEKVWPFISIYHNFDVVGQFYGEFLKYTGGDKKSLGIVLTPRHITDLFARIANVQVDSRILDTCAGTGGFLISAMHRMMAQAVTDEERDRIKSHGLIGVEDQPNMYALAASNMILRGDGKANLHQGSCFDSAIIAEVTKCYCDVGMLNPPYSQDEEDLHELEFVKQMLSCLRRGAVGIAILPMSCAISPHPLKEELLRHHTLEAVMSMPQELFYPVGVVTCIMVFRAHQPHANAEQKTWFGYWREDGFVKTKHLGRVDLYGRWPAIRDRWVDQYRNREEHAGECVKRQVTAIDEWCAEAYMETDYNQLTKEQFERQLKKYLVFSVLNEVVGDPNDVDDEEDPGVGTLTGRDAG